MFHWLRRKPARPIDLPRYHVKLLRPERLGNGQELWAACFEELPTCIGQGQTSGEAEGMLWRILPGYLEQLRQHGQPIPVPDPNAGVAVNNLRQIETLSGIRATVTIVGPKGTGTATRKLSVTG